jgi:hypothetical protein
MKGNGGSTCKEMVMLLVHMENFYAGCYILGLPLLDQPNAISEGSRRARGRQHVESLMLQA